MSDGADSGRVIGWRSVWPPSLANIEAARRGDREAMGSILATGYPKLVSFYRGMGMTRTEAEDIASEAVEGMIVSLPRLREPAAFEGWFWTIARNRVRSVIRKRGRVVYELDHAPIDDPADLAIAADEHADIRLALAKLSPRDRQILWLREVEQLEYAEIAGRMGIAAGAARVAALRARRKLEAEYGKHRPGDVR